MIYIRFIGIFIIIYHTQSSFHFIFHVDNIVDVVGECWRSQLVNPGCQRPSDHLHGASLRGLAAGACGKTRGPGGVEDGGG